MRKTLLLIIAFAIFTTSQAQEKAKQKELGFAFSNLDNFGLTFKTGNSKAMWRFSALVANGSNDKFEQDDREYDYGSFGINTKFGRENIVEITKNIEFNYGLDLSFGYTKGKYIRGFYDDPTNDTELNYSMIEVGVNFVLGFNYVINDKLVLGATIHPGYSRYKREETETDFDGNEMKTTRKGSNYGLSNSSAQLSIAVRF